MPKSGLGNNPLSDMDEDPSGLIQDTSSKKVLGRPKSKKTWVKSTLTYDPNKMEYIKVLASQGRKKNPRDIIDEALGKYLNRSKIKKMLPPNLAEKLESEDFYTAVGNTDL